MRAGQSLAARGAVTLAALVAAAPTPAACGRRAHWSEGYIGLPYIPGAHDCAHLVERVQREIFGRAVAVPAERSGWRSRELSAQIAEAAPGLARRRTGEPQAWDPRAVLQEQDDACDGDPVLMIGAGRLNHIGVLVTPLGQPVAVQPTALRESVAECSVLHNFVRARQVVLTRVRDLPRWGLELEGVYAWL